MIRGWRRVRLGGDRVAIERHGAGGLVFVCSTLLIRRVAARRRSCGFIRSSAWCVLGKQRGSMGRFWRARDQVLHILQPLCGVELKRIATLPPTCRSAGLFHPAHHI